MTGVQTCALPISDGAVAKRAVGLPRKADVIAALGAVVQPASPRVAQQAGGE